MEEYRFDRQQYGGAKSAHDINRLARQAERGEYEGRSAFVQDTFTWDRVPGRKYVPTNRNGYGRDGIFVIIDGVIGGSLGALIAGKAGGGGAAVFGAIVGCVLGVIFGGIHGGMMGGDMGGDGGDGGGGE